MKFAEHSLRIAFMGAADVCLFFVGFLEGSQSLSICP